jgi:hypothetical protein
MIWSRTSNAEPFDDHRYIDVPDIAPLVGRSPRYVPATHELFMTRLSKENRWSIWVVKNFDLSHFVE